jgi:thiosulfate reductase/polysulfide reductase chain A
MKTMPDRAETIKAINNLDLLVAIDIVPADIIQWADVVLPECTYLERHDSLSLGKFKKFEVSIRQPAVEPMWESKPSWWITKELAKKMGLEAYFPWKDGDEYLAKRCEAGGINYAELKQKGVITKDDKSAPYITAENQPTFDTPSGKIELYSPQLKAKGFDPVPQYTKHPQPPEGHFSLLFGRSPLHTFSRTTNNFMLTDLVPENSVWINRKKAKQLGLADGQYVRLQNPNGFKSPGKIKVRLTERLREDCLYMVHGFGVHSPGMKRAHNKGVGDEEMLAGYRIDPIMGGTGMRSNFVKIVKEG